MQISRVQKMLGDEFGTASNIKSRVNRQSVLGAITSAQQRLKLYNRARVSTSGRGLVAAEVASALCLVKVDASAAVCRFNTFTVPGPTVHLVASRRWSGADAQVLQQKLRCGRRTCSAGSHVQLYASIAETQQTRVRAQMLH